MEGHGEISRNDFHKVTDPLMLRAYTEALKQKQKWQASIDELIRVVLDLGYGQSLDPGRIPSAEEIRKEMTHYIPENEKLSDVLITIREG